MASIGKLLASQGLRNLTSSALKAGQVNTLSQRFLSQSPVVLAAEPTARIPVTLIPGDGVGPELVDAVKEVFSASGVPVDFDTFYLSEIHPSSSTATLEEVINSVTQNSVCLMGHLGALEVSKTGELDSLAMKFRRRLDLFANVVRVKTHAGIPTKHKNVDLVVIREQIEGECKDKKEKN